METTLTIGKHYIVKFRGGEKAVRRIYKGSEKRFKTIDCFVFSSKADKRVTMEAIPDGFQWHIPYGVKSPNQEVSIPYYDLISVREAIKPLPPPINRFMPLATQTMQSTYSKPKLPVIAENKPKNEGLTLNNIRVRKHREKVKKRTAIRKEIYSYLDSIDLTQKELFEILRDYEKCKINGI